MLHLRRVRHATVRVVARDHAHGRATQHAHDEQDDGLLVRYLLDRVPARTRQYPRRRRDHERAGRQLRRRDALVDSRNLVDR